MVVNFFPTIHSMQSVNSPLVAADGSDEDERGAGRQKSYVESQADLKREFLQLVDVGK